MSTESLPNPAAPDEAPATPADATPLPEAVDASAAAPADADAAAAAPDTAVAAPVREMSLGACSRELAKRFPALFGEHPKPIKLRIQADIQQRAPGVFSKKILSIFLHRHTTQTAYLVALSKARQRFDLDGQPAGELADEHREAATQELARRRAVVQERRAAEEDARRQRFALVRDFERTTLTRSNFCALKGIAEAELDTLLATIRQEIAAWEASRPPAAERPGGRPGPRGEGGPRRGRDDQGRPARGPRRDGAGGGRRPG